MKARSIFNGTLRIDDLRIPVKLYSAVEPRPVEFRLLHASDHVPIRQRMVHPTTGEEVPREQARKGLVLPGGMVMLRDEELAERSPEPSANLDILRFVAPARIDHRWYVRPYYLGPHGPGRDAERYFAFARALATAGAMGNETGGELGQITGETGREGKAGIVRWTMRNKLYRGALLPIGDYLVLFSLRSVTELVTYAALPDISWPTPSEAELKMARQLIEMLATDLDWDAFHDRYAEQVVALAEAKASGRAAELPAAKPKPAAEASLAETLAASIARIEAQRVA